MAAKVCGFTVVLGQDLTQEEAREVVKLLKLIKGVVEVTPVQTSMPHYVAKAQARTELQRELVKVLHPRVAEQMEESEGIQSL